MSETRSHFPMPDDSESLTCDIWQEPDLKDPSDQDELAERQALKAGMFAVFFGSVEDRQAGKPLPFHELPDAAIALLPKNLRDSYVAERDAALDRRSGVRLRTRGS